MSDRYCITCGQDLLRAYEPPIECEACEVAARYEAELGRLRSELVAAQAEVDRLRAGIEAASSRADRDAALRPMEEPVTNCLTCQHRLDQGPDLKACALKLHHAPGLATWIVNHWTSDEADQPTPCPHHKEVPVTQPKTHIERLNIEGYSPTWPEGQTLEDYNKIVAGVEKELVHRHALLSLSELRTKYEKVMGQRPENTWTFDGLDQCCARLSWRGVWIKLGQIIEARRKDLAEAEAQPENETATPRAHVSRNTDGSYACKVDGVGSKSAALDEAKRQGKVIGIPPWAWRKDHVYPKGGGSEPEVYRYKTGDPASLERQWQTLMREGVLPKDTPRPLILETAPTQSRVLRNEPPEAVLRKLDSTEQQRLRGIWPGYLAKETDEEMATRLDSFLGGCISASTVRRLRQKVGLPTMRSGSGTKAQLPDVCYEAPAVRMAPTPPAGVVSVNQDLENLVKLLGIPEALTLDSRPDIIAKIRGTVRRLQAQAFQADEMAKVNSNQAEVIHKLEQKIHNQRQEIKKRTTQKPYPKIESVVVYEVDGGGTGRPAAANNVLLKFFDGTEARLSVPSATTLPAIVERLRNTGWCEVPPAVEFQKVRSGEFRYPPEEILVEVPMAKVDPSKEDLGLGELPEHSYYKATDPFTAAALKKAGHPYRVPIQGRHSNYKVKWVAHTPGQVVRWG